MGKVLGPGKLRLNRLVQLAGHSQSHVRSKTVGAGWRDGLSSNLFLLFVFGPH